MYSQYFSLLLYHLYTLDTFLLANAVGMSISLAGVLPYVQFIPSLTYNSLAPNPTPDASVSR